MGQDQESVQWRSTFAILANPALRRRLAEHILAEAEPSSRKKLSDSTLDQRLQESGILSDFGGELVVNQDGLRDALAEVNEPVVGWERFLRDGQFVAIPLKVADQEPFLRWLLERIALPDEPMSERELSERLAEYTSDPALLRRYFIDFGLLTRLADGSEYRLAAL